MTRSYNSRRGCWHRGKWDKADMEYRLYDGKSKCNWKRDMIKFDGILFTPKYKKKRMNRWCSYGFIRSEKNEETGEWERIVGWKSIPYNKQKGYRGYSYPIIDKTREEYRTWSWYIGSYPNLKGYHHRNHYFF